MASSVQVSDPGSYKLAVIFHGSQVTQVTGNEENIIWEEEEDHIGGGEYNIMRRQKAVVSGKESYRAVKSISRDFCTKNGFDFQRQVQALILMQNYPDLFIEFSGWYEDDSRFFIVMEYAPLGNLDRYIKELKHDAHSNVISITQQLLEALAVLHEKDLYHRNLKPSNVLITSLTPLHIKLVDFEASKSTINSGPEISHGIIAYSAPEMLGYLDPIYRLGTEHPYAVDIWALGCLVHEILTGETPFLNHGVERELGSNQNDMPALNLLASFCLGKVPFPADKLEKSEADKEAIDFTRKLLVAQPYSRPSAEEALDHVWLLGCRSYESFKLETVVYEDRVAHTTPGPTEAITTEWTNVAQIGAGGFGSVVLESGVARGVECGLRAVKRVHRDFHKFGLSREVSAMVAVRDRPEMFVRLFGWFETRDCFCIAMEYLKYGDLGDYLSKKGKELKPQIADITSQILKGLVVLHQREICHRDLKPQNVLIASLSPIRVKLADFGVSKLSQGTSLKSMVGTAGYTAPELLGLYQSRKKRNSNSYTNAIDMWSLGCMVYKMLTVSKLPFLGDQEEMMDDTSMTSGIYTRTQESGDSIDMEKFCNFCEGRIDLPVQALYDSTTPKGIDFVKKLLVANPELRMMAKAALEHDWLTEQTESLENLDIAKTHLIDLGINPEMAENFVQAHKEGGKPETIRGILTEIGKSPETLSHEASGKGYDLLLDMLLSTSMDILNSTTKGWTLMQTAAKGGHLGVVKLLLKHGADVNAEPGTLPGGRTALQAAAEYGHLHLVKFLLEKGADIHGKQAQTGGLTALQAAASRGHSEIMRILINLKADLNEEPCKANGRTALQAAAENGHTAAVNLLLHHAAKVNAAPCGETGRTALQAAAGNGHVSIVKTLLENSADVNASPCASWGRTALQAAAEKGRIKVVKLLLENSADVNAGPCKKGGKTALWAAAEMGHCSVVRLLLDHGADFHECSGKAVPEIAEENGHFEIAELLLEYVSS